MRSIASLLAVVAVGAGCGSAVDDELRDLRSSGGPPVYYLGERFAGLPLTEIDPGPNGRVLFVYGECDLEGEGDTFVCRKPTVQVQVFPFRPGDWRLAVGCRRLPMLRGVPTVRHDGLVLVTARTVVKIYARDPAEDRRAALALRSVGTTAGAVGPLPAPSADVRELVMRACGG